MTQSEWLDHWLSRAPVLSEAALEDIHHTLSVPDDDEAARSGAPN